MWAPSAWTASVRPRCLSAIRREAIIDPAGSSHPSTLGEYPPVTMRAAPPRALSAK